MVVIDRSYLKPFLKRLLFSFHPHTDSAEMENYFQIFSEWARGSLLCEACSHHGSGGVNPLCSPSPGAQSDSELSPHHVSEVNVDRGYTSDSEVYTEHSKARIPRSTTDVDVASSGWLVVSAHAHTCTRTCTC